MAVRAVIYDDHRGGYIDNVPATFTRKNTDIGIHYARLSGGQRPAVPERRPPSTGYCVPPGSPSLNNASLVGNAINPVTYQGIRVEALYKINDDWNVLLTQSYQDMNSQGVFYQQPNASDGAPLQPLEVTLFNPAYDKDKFESTAWTVNGKIGASEGRLYRRLPRCATSIRSATTPITARGVYADYYQCYGPAAPRQCLAVHLLLAERHLALERAEQAPAARVPPEHAGRLALARHRRRLLGGQQAVRPDRLDVQDHPAVHLGRSAARRATPAASSNVGTFPGTTVQNPGVQGDNTSFYQDTACARPSRPLSSPPSTSTSSRRC